ncbi:MAG: trypsin-like peptidase domain-containing protein [Chloroflexota bacterium]
MQRNYTKQLLWIAGCFMLAFVLLTGVAIGGVAGYIFSNQINPDSQEATPSLVTSASDLVVLEPEPVLSIPPAAPAQQAPLIIEESSAIDTVEKVLPAVVTVLNQGNRGGGSGSGFFISEEGYVVTNHHVIEDARELTIVYAQGGTAPATLIGSAPEFDLAVIKVDGPVPAVAQWGDSGELPLGANVIAMGSALGRYQNTVTAGILSGFNRELGGFRGLLQTDAAINHGNSGGPLTNLAGQVVGINAMVVRGGLSEAEGLGFAIPSNIAANVVEQLIESGDVSPPFLGIQYQEINPQLALEEGLNLIDGAFLQEVVSNTPASRAGLRAGDIILSIDGQTLDDRHPLVSVLLEHVAGETISLEILRDGQRFQTSVTLGERA